MWPNSRAGVGFALLRIAFGIVWAIDASFKWQPGFMAHIVSDLSGAMQGQPAAVQAWIGFWLDIVKLDPSLFAKLLAIAETSLAIALILGLFTNLACVGGMVLSFFIWSTAEGLGGPYGPASTDVGTSIIYEFVYVAIMLSAAGRQLSVDKWLGPKLGRWAFLASGRE